MKNTIHNLTRQLSEAIDGEPWIDETFSKKLSSLSEEQAFTRPLPSVHSVAELVSHLLEWRISARFGQFGPWFTGVDPKIRHFFHG